MSSEVAGDCLEFVPVMIAVQTVIHMIVDQRLFGVADRAFDGLQLLRDIEAGASVFYHGYDRAQVSLSTFQPRYDLGMACMDVGVCHRYMANLPGGMAQDAEYKA